MKCPSRSLINKLTEDGDIFYNFPDFYGEMIEKYVDLRDSDRYHQRMRSHMRHVEKMSSMMFRLAEHLDDWRSERYPEEDRIRSREKSILGMLVFVPLLIDFCLSVKEDGVIGEPVARRFAVYLDTFSSIWNSAVEGEIECPYPVFMPSRAEFEPFIEFFYDFVEEMKTMADDDFSDYAGGVYMHLYHLFEDISACENRSLLDRQFTEYRFAWKLIKALPEVRTLKESLTESGFKNEDLDNLLALLESSLEKYNEADAFFEKEAERVFGKKFVRLAVRG